MNNTLLVINDSDQRYSRLVLVANALLPIDSKLALLNLVRFSMAYSLNSETNGCSN